MPCWITWRVTSDEVVGQAEIAEHVWDENFDAFSNLIEVYMQRLRRKIDDGHSPKLLRTIREKVTCSPRRQIPPMLESLRTRLTLWYVGILAVVLVAFSTGVYTLVERTLHAHQDGRLRSVLKVSTETLSQSGQSQSSVAERLQKLEFPNQVVVVFDSEGKVIAQKPEGRGVRPCVPAKPYALKSLQFFELPDSAPDADDSCRGLYRDVSIADSDQPYFISVSESTEPLSDQLDTLQYVLELGAAVAMLAAGVGGWLFARRSLAPLAMMATTTRRITAENLDERVPVHNPRNELGQLATSFNQLLSRLSTAFSQQRQFMTDASHELRTPLSVMRTAAQVARLPLDRGLLPGRLTSPNSGAFSVFVS